jgi:hypothetical protein
MTSGRADSTQAEVKPGKWLASGAGRLGGHHASKWEVLR